MDSSVTPSTAMRVLLVDDHPVVRQGLAFVLAVEGIEVSAEAGGRAEALRRVEDRRPDLAIVDLSLEGEDGLVLIAELDQRNVPVLVYSMHHDPAWIAGAFGAGALGYVTKRELQGVLLEAVREVAKRRRFISPMAVAALAQSFASASATDAVRKLSPHERKTYELLAQGEGTFEIAAALHVSSHTVESYYERIKVKLGLSSMHDLRRHAISHLQKRAG